MEKRDLINEILQLRSIVIRAERLHDFDRWIDLPAIDSQFEEIIHVTGRGDTGFGKPVTNWKVAPEGTAGRTMCRETDGLNDNLDSRNVWLLRAWKRRNPDNPVTVRERIRNSLLQSLDHLSVDDLLSLKNELKALIMTIVAHENAEEIEMKMAMVK